MKILIIADNLGDNAPGVVFRNVLKGLNEKINYDLITSTPNYHAINNGLFTFVKQKRLKSWRIRTYLFILQGYYITQKNWAKQVQRIIKDKEYDVIISFMSSTFYASLLAAKYYLQNHRAKHLCYCVDAIPAPIPWEKDGLYYQTMRKFVQKNMSNIDVLCMTNKEMLNYELGIIGNNKIRTVAIPNPPLSSKMINLSIESIEPSFAFAGQIYGLRNPIALLKGFEMFVQKHRNAKLYFIGTRHMKKYISEINLTTQKNIVILPYTHNLQIIYEKCCALIDINANCGNDVFLSSKFISYIPYNRIIITESSNDSPVRSLFSKNETIIHINHDYEQYYRAMEYSYNHRMDMDYTERELILDSINIDAAANKIITNII